MISQPRAQPEIRALKSTYAPGMTDMMVSPESLDEFMDANPLPTEKDSRMTSEQIKHLVDRFLQWRLPEDFNPDNGISYKRPNYAAEVDATPSGTNLFDAAQATDMVRFMVEGMPASSLPDETVSEEMVEQAREIVAENSGCSSFRCFHDDECACRDVSRQILALAHADDGWRPTHVHINSGRKERFLRIAKYKAASNEEWVECVVYDNSEGMMFITSVGRWHNTFVALPAPPKDGRE